MVLQPGEESPYHRHEADYVFVYTTPSRITAYLENQAPSTSTFEDGFVQYTEVGPGTTHYIRNAGDVEHRQILVEFKGSSARAWNPDEVSAGIDLSCLPWLRTRGVAVLGSDADADARPSQVADVHTPAHALALALGAMGMPLLDNMNLDGLAATCADERRWEFLFVTAPLRLPGGTGWPINPLAVF
jgi:kynurenine formamidase